MGAGFVSPAHIAADPNRHLCHLARGEPEPQDCRDYVLTDARAFTTLSLVEIDVF